METIEKLAFFFNNATPEKHDQLMRHMGLGTGEYSREKYNLLQTHPERWLNNWTTHNMWKIEEWLHQNVADGDWIENSKSQFKFKFKVNYLDRTCDQMFDTIITIEGNPKDFLALMKKQKNVRKITDHTTGEILFFRPDEEF